MEEAAAGNASAVDSGEFDRRHDETKNRFGVGLIFEVKMTHLGSSNSDWFLR